MSPEELAAWEAYLADPHAVRYPEQRYSEWSLMPAWLQQTYLDFSRAMSQEPVHEVRRVA